MNITVKRDIFTDISTIGELSLDGQFECFTLENPIRAEKIEGHTAIPGGTYQVIFAVSPRFSRPHGSRLCPHLLNVLGFTDILIHMGNTSKDTEGCLLVGKEKGPDSIYQSRKALAQLLLKMWRKRKEGLVLTIA